MNDLQFGKYQHYKGNMYEVIGCARHSETLEEMVVYKQLYTSNNYNEGSVWVRPKAMFFEMVTLDGKATARFKFISQ